jgi:hypothetical protein
MRLPKIRGKNPITESQLNCISGSTIELRGVIKQHTQFVNVTLHFLITPKILESKNRDNSRFALIQTLAKRYITQNI